MESDLELFGWLYSNFDGVLTTYIAETSTAIVAAISPVAWTMFAIYILLWGFSMIRGLIDEPVTDALFRLLKIAIILGFALNAGRYQSDVVSFFMDTPGAMANILAFNGSAESGDTSTFESLDVLLNRTVEVSRSAWNQAGMFSGNFGMYFVAMFILILGVAFTLVAGIIILVAKIAMVLLLALGPIFILMTMFKTTQRFFDAWLGQVINYMLTLILALAVTTMFLAMMEVIVQNAGEKVVSEAMIEACATMAVISVACIVLLFQVGPLASALGGGVALATTSAVRRLSADAGQSGVKAAMTGKAATLVAGKATLGAAVAAKAAGQMFRASNSISRS